MTSRERVQRCLNFETPDRMPRDLWMLPWFSARHPDAVEKLRAAYPVDFGGAPNVGRPSSRAHGDPFANGEYTDAWGCDFINMHAGVIGEVKHAVLTDPADYKTVIQPPYETLPEDFTAARDTVNRTLDAPGGHDKFIKSGCFNPWERYQYYRGTMDAMCDVMDPDDAGVKGAIAAIHGYFMKELEFWTSTDVDAVFLMDDWGAQNQLLIPPDIWRAVFKPLYREACDLAHSRGKYVFMHSDGFIEEIYPDLIEIGVNALNSQLFCMDFDHLKQWKGRITFWGEIDRQHVMVSSDPAVIHAAVQRVADALYDPRGGIIAQFELGPGCHPDAGMAAFDAWRDIENHSTS